jgi:4-amino-4-deoxy-L-arabinose transferase-like glycosyltransferase
MNGTPSHPASAFFERRYPWCIAFLFALAAFLFFFRLGVLPVQDWDEARNGINASEMAQSGNWTVTTWLKEPDYWNSKPPLAIQAQALSILAFGDTPFAMRFPSALAGFLTLLLTVRIARERYGRAASLFAGLFLCTAYGFMNLHAARSGNFDGFLTLFFTLGVFALERAGRNAWALPLFGISAALAFLSKSFAVLPLFSIALLYLPFSPERKNTRIWQYLAAALLFLLPVAVWAFFRFRADGTAFFRAMLDNDLLHRTTVSVDGLPTFSLWYVFVILGDFFPWSPLVVLLIFFRNRLSVTAKGGKPALSLELSEFFHNPLVFLWAALPFALYSLVTTKVDWYMIPVYPALAASAGWLCAELLGEKRAFRIVTPVRLLVYCGFFALLYAVALPAVVIGQDRDTYQRAMLSLPHAKGATMWFADRSRNQGEVYVAEAMMGYRPAWISNSFAPFLASTNRADVLFGTERALKNPGGGTNGLRILFRVDGFFAAAKR